ncbi:SRPBCC domain-containing protein [Aequorivita sp. SDUM287046]|uniref:SRPBCC domain-containing protein n=1 Tax=Aequorivita aurantiaca TaxID=3053356 RepID=A0ABT8DMZ5_9FLAO|nr:SRPBCC domain-containing protein [Aequorivita aurantiaca]MDN3724432.1 SRPBCC domain-containing protein [Aequorivita aurantiaca]
MEQKTLKVERTYNAPISKVWNAITDKNEMKQWYFDLAEFKPEVGFKFEFMGGTEEKQYLHLCEVTEVVPEKKITYSWRYDGYDGNSYVTFELFEEGNNTRLQLTHRGLETFPDKDDFARSNFEQGWDYFMNTALKVFLED